MGLLVGPIYIAEIAPASVRSFLSHLPQIGYCAVSSSSLHHLVPFLPHLSSLQFVHRFHHLPSLPSSTILMGELSPETLPDELHLCLRHIWRLCNPAKTNQFFALGTIGIDQEGFRIQGDALRNFTSVCAFMTSLSVFYWQPYRCCKPNYVNRSSGVSPIKNLTVVDASFSFLLSTLYLVGKVFASSTLRVFNDPTGAYAEELCFNFRLNARPITYFPPKFDNPKKLQHVQVSVRIVEELLPMTLLIDEMPPLLDLKGKNIGVTGMHHTRLCHKMRLLPLLCPNLFPNSPYSSVSISHSCLYCVSFHPFLFADLQHAKSEKRQCQPLLSKPLSIIPHRRCSCRLLCPCLFLVSSLLDFPILFLPFRFSHLLLCRPAICRVWKTTLPSTPN
ncbi:hypothetical protein LINGRAHAP2_LOCUS2720 [Linum grandiflorum]